MRVKALIGSLFLPISVALPVMADNSRSVNFNGYSVIFALAFVGFLSARFIKKEPNDRTEFI